MSGKKTNVKKMERSGCSQAVLEVNEPSDDGKNNSF